MSLELGYNGLTDRSAQLIGDVLKFNFKLEGLSLWQNQIGPTGAQSIANGLQNNKSLLWLGLGSNQVGVEGAWAISEALQTNSSLLWLGLGGNGIGDRGAMHLAGLLQGMELMTSALSICLFNFAGNMCCLQSLGLGGNEIHNEGACHLALALRVNRRLRSIGLGGNQICMSHPPPSPLLSTILSLFVTVADEGGGALADMLTHNQTLKKLLLSSNLLGNCYILRLLHHLISLYKEIEGLSSYPLLWKSTQD